MREQNKFRRAGLLLGLAMAGLGSYLVSTKVIVGGGYWTFSGGNTFGVTLAPLLAGIAILFFRNRNPFGLLLTAGGAVFALASAIARFHIHFERTTLLQTIGTVVLLIGGMALIARAIRPGRSLAGE